MILLFDNSAEFFDDSLSFSHILNNQSMLTTIYQFIDIFLYGHHIEERALKFGDMHALLLPLSEELELCLDECTL